MSRCPHGHYLALDCVVCNQAAQIDARRNSLATSASSFAAEARQILMDDRDAWKARALAAEAELLKWHGYVNQQRPDLKPTILQRLGALFHVRRGRQ